MREQHRPLYDVQFELKKSIFPTFNVNAPMPQGTPEPPQMVVRPSGGQRGTGTGSEGSSQPSQRPADQ
jgi:hypothetical protein